MSEHEDILIRHFQGNSNLQEEQQISDLMKTDETFRETAEKIWKEVEIADILAQKELEENIKNRGFNHIYDNKSRHKANNIVIFISIVVIILLTIFYAVRSNLDKKEEIKVEEIYAVNFKQLRSPNNSSEQFRGIEQIILNRDVSQYQSSIDLLSSILANDSKSDKANYLLGHLYFLKEEYSKADEFFKKSQSTGDSDLLNQAKWYQALALLGAKDVERSKVILKQLADSDSTFSSKAKDILGSL